MADSSFDDRIRELADKVGTGSLKGSLEVSQLYALAQHENLSYRHPRGGQAEFLRQPLLDRHGDYLQKIADALLDGGAADAMADAMEDLSGQVERLAPIELGNLRQSGHPTVTDKGATVYDRAPIQHRLTEQELRALHPDID